MPLPSVSEIGSSASTLAEAGKRVAALALVDASLALPERARPVTDAALSALSVRPSNGAEFMYYRPSTAAKPSALLVLCHPSEGASMCRSLADIWEEQLNAVGVNVVREELGAGREGPALSLHGAGELRAALTGKDPDGEVPDEVRRLQGLVEACQFLIFVHPIFWFDVPSQLKAFQESVLSSGFAFRKLPGHWLLNRAASIAEKLPVAPRLLRRYAAYGLLRDKRVFVTRTMGGPQAGLGIFDHGATSLESSMQFCGAHLAAVDTLSELDDTSADELRTKALPKFQKQVEAHCQRIASLAAASVPAKSLLTKVQRAALPASDVSSGDEAVGA